MQGACIDAWMHNKLENGCFGNFGHEQCLEMGCVPNNGIHTFTESCLEDGPCPHLYHLENNGGTINFNCPDADAEATCTSTFGPVFQLTSCLEVGCVLTSDSTYEEWCVSPDETTNAGDVCPSDCNLVHNQGTVNFICPDMESEAMCQATFGPNFTQYHCLSLGCVMDPSATYQEWCEGGSCGYPNDPDNGPSSQFCPSDCYLMQNHGTINFICPDMESEAMCQATFGPNFTLHECLHLGCHLSEDSTYQEWCEGGSCGFPDDIGTGGTGTGGTGTGGTDGGPYPAPGPDGCPSGFEFIQTGTTVSFDCPDADSESQCVSTFGHNFTMYTCLSVGCVLTDDADFQEWCQPFDDPHPTSGPHQCPVGTYPHNNGGTLWFDCPDPTVMNQCRETFSSDDYSYMLAMCLSYGCTQHADSTYAEWCDESPTNNWEPIPMCPDNTTYNLTGDIKWYCMFKSMQAIPLCMQYMDNGYVWGGQEQEAIHDCFYNYGTVK